MNNQSGINRSIQNAQGVGLDIIIVNTLLKNRKIVIPDFGYLELKFFPDRRTVLFKATDPLDLPLELHLDGLEEEDHFSILLNCISNPLKEGKVVSMPNLGIFRPLRKEDGSYYVSFTLSSFLRKRLNEEQFVSEDTKEIPQVKVKKELLIEKVEQKLPIIEQKPEEFVPFGEKQEELSVVEVEKNYFFSEDSQSSLDLKAKSEPKTNEIEKNNIIQERETNNNSVGQNTIIEERLPSQNRTKRSDPVVFSIEKETEDSTSSLDEIVEMKKTNIAGILLGSVSAIALLVVVFTFFIQGKEKKEDIPPLPSQSKSQNLVDLARKNYGNPVFWVYIYESNRDKFNRDKLTTPISPFNIPEGVKLTIPDLSEYDVDMKDTMELVRAKMRAEDILQKYKK